MSNKICFVMACIFANTILCMEPNDISKKSELWQSLNLVYVDENVYPSWFFNDLPAHECRNIFNWENLDSELMEIPAFANNLQSKLKPAPINYEECKNSERLSILEGQGYNYVVVHEDELINLKTNVTIKRHPIIDGYGAYANKAFAQGEIIGEYVGEIKYLNPDQTIRRCAQRNRQLLEDLISIGSGSKHPILYHDTLVDGAVIKNDEEKYASTLLDRHFLFLSYPDRCANWFTAPLMVDASVYRNETAFINHSRFPNSEKILAFKFKRVKTENGYRFRCELAIYVIATKAISISDEILTNYSWPDNKIREEKLSDLAPTTFCFGCQATNKSCQVECDCKFAKYCSEACRIRDKSPHEPFCSFLRT